MAIAKKKTGLKKKYIKLAGKGGFKKAWALQKAASRKSKAARKKAKPKKTTRKKTVRKKVVKKTVRKKVTKRKSVPKKVVRKKVVKRKSTIKRKGPNMAKKKQQKRRKRRNPRVNIQKTLMDGALAVAGAVGASAIANMIPGLDPRMKAGIPILGAVILPTMKIVRPDTAKAMSMGMLTIGAVSLVKQFAPQLPLLAGEDDLDYLPTKAEQAAMLGAGDPLENFAGGEMVQVAGEMVKMAGDDDDFVTMDDV